MWLIRKIGLVLTILAIWSIGAAQGPEGQSPTLAKIMEEGVMRVGIAETIPNAWKDPTTGEWLGYNVQAARELTNSLGVRIEFIEAGGQTWIPQLHQGKFDIHMLGWFMTPLRAVQVDFTDPVFIKGYAVIVRDDSPVMSLEELNDPQYSVTGVVGGAEEIVHSIFLPDATTQFLNTTSPLDGALAVRAGRATAWIYPADVIQAFLDKNEWARLLNPEPIWNNPLAYAIRKGDPEWKIFLDAYVTKIKLSGDLDRWIDEAAEQAIEVLGR